VIGAALRALPDAITALVFLKLWLSPLAFGEWGVQHAQFVLLVEFVLIHASGALGGAIEGDRSRAIKLLWVAAFVLFYLMFIASLAEAAGHGWPILAFLWLLLGKLGRLFGNLDCEDARWQRHSDWAIGMLLFVGGAFATLAFPVPELGITAEVRPLLGIEGHGDWVDEPQRPIAFGVLYFGLLSLARFTGFRLPRSWFPALRER
jgi:hypothetical protein